MEHINLPEDQEADALGPKPIDEEKPKQLSHATGFENEIAVAVCRI